MAMTAEKNLPAILRQPNAFLPIVISAIAFGVVIVHLAVTGDARDADEGVAAHLWQLLMAGQVPIVALSLVRSLRRAPRTAMITLALQLGAALLAVAPVYLLQL